MGTFSIIMPTSLFHLLSSIDQGQEAVLVQAFGDQTIPCRYNITGGITIAVRSALPSDRYMHIYFDALSQKQKAPMNFLSIL